MGFFLYVVAVIRKLEVVVIRVHAEDNVPVFLLHIVDGHYRLFVYAAVIYHKGVPRVCGEDSDRRFVPVFLPFWVRKRCSECGPGGVHPFCQLVIASGLAGVCHIPVQGIYVRGNLVVLCFAGGVFPADILNRLTEGVAFIEAYDFICPVFVYLVVDIRPDFLGFIQNSGLAA